MIEKIAKLKPEDLISFKTTLEADCQYIFDGLSEDEKYIIVAIDSLSDDELKQLLNQQELQIGLHDIHNYLQIMYSVTLNPRYQK